MLSDVMEHFGLSKTFAQADGFETKSIFSVVRETDSVFDHEILPYDGKDGLN